MNLQIMVQHLRDQVKELQGTKDALAVSKLREDTLQNQVFIVLNFINTLVLSQYSLSQYLKCHSKETTQGDYFLGKAQH